MKKTLLSALLFFSLLVTQLATPAALAAEGDGAGTSSTVESMYIQAKAAILVDDDYGEVLYEQNAHEKNYPASITKVMTTLLVLEAVDRGEAALTDIVTVGDEVNLGIGEGGSGVGLKEGEQLSLEDLLYCALTASANEACNALAQYLCGDVATFVERMNQRAAELGMEDTHFANTHGYHDENHYTTAYDIYLMCHEAMQNPTFRTIVSSVGHEVPATNIDQRPGLHLAHHRILVPVRHRHQDRLHPRGGLLPGLLGHQGGPAPDRRGAGGGEPQERRRQHQPPPVLREHPPFGDGI